MILKRTIFDIFLFISIFILPWWVVCLLALVGIFIFTNFYEFIITGIIFYSLYLVTIFKSINSAVFFIVIILLTYIIIQIIRDRIIFYRK